MNALRVVDAEIEWWERKASEMRHPREQLALACAIGATTALGYARQAIAAAARQGGDVKQAPAESPQSGHGSGIAQVSSETPNA